MLKFSFLLIILANLVFLLWEFQQGAFSKKDYSANDKTVNQEILLIDEAPVQTIAQHDQAALKENSLAQTTQNAIDSGTKPAVLVKTDINSNTLVQQSKIKPDGAGKLNLPHKKPVETIPAQSESTLETTKNTKKPIKSGERDASAISQIAAEKNQSSAVSVTPAKQAALSPQPLANDHKDKLVSADKTITPHCFDKQFFNSKKAAENWLQQHSISGDIQEIERPVASSYLVYIPAAENYQQAKQTVQTLTEKGIKDFWLFRKGPMKNAISLGLFVKQYRAEKLTLQLQAKGIKVKTEVRYKPIKQWRVTPDNSDCVNTTPQL